MSISNIRRNNFMLLIEKYEGQIAIAKASGKSIGYISQIATGHRNLGESSSRNFEHMLGLPKGWLDAPRTLGEYNASFPLETWDALQPQARSFVLTVLEYLRLSDSSASNEEEHKLLALFRACSPEARQVVLAVAQAQSGSKLIR